MRSGAVNSGALNTHAFNEPAPEAIYLSGAAVGAVASVAAPLSKRAAFTAAVASASAAPAAAVAKRGAVISGLAAQATVSVASVSKRGTIGASIAAALSVDAHQTLGLVVSAAAAAVVTSSASMAKRNVLTPSAVAAQSAAIQALVSTGASVRGTEVGRLTVAAHSTLGYVVRALSEAYSSALARDVALIQVGGAGPVWPARERRSVWVLVARPTTWIVAYRKKRVGRAAAAVGPAPSIFVQMPLRERTSSAFNVGPVLGAVVGG